MMSLTKKIGLLGLLVLIVCNSSNVNAQRMSREEVNDTIKNMPSFSSYHDNYLISGIPTNKSANKMNSDIKYQISFKQLISRATLPLNSYLFVSYTQKAFWNI